MHTCSARAIFTLIDMPGGLDTWPRGINARGDISGNDQLKAGLRRRRRDADPW